jgi:hypothetical protein
MSILFEYLKKNYKFDDPIFLCDIKIDGLTSNNIRQQMKKIVDAGYLIRYTNGIYCFKYQGNNPDFTKKIIETKYIQNNNQRFGYYSGITFLNMIGISNQYSHIPEIVSNNTKPIVKKILINKKPIILKKPRIHIDNSNADILPYLEALVSIDKFDDNDIDTSNFILKRYAKKFNITKDKALLYIDKFPTKIYKTIFTRGEKNVFA